MQLVLPTPRQRVPRAIRRSWKLAATIVSSIPLSFACSTTVFVDPHAAGLPDAEIAILETDYLVESIEREDRLELVCRNSPIDVPPTDAEHSNPCSEIVKVPAGQYRISYFFVFRHEMVRRIDSVHLEPGNTYRVGVDFSRTDIYIENAGTGAVVAGRKLRPPKGPHSWRTEYRSRHTRSNREDTVAPDAGAEP